MLELIGSLQQFYFFQFQLLLKKIQTVINNIRGKNMSSPLKISHFTTFSYVQQKVIVKHYDLKECVSTKPSNQVPSTFDDSLTKHIDEAVEMATPEQAHLLDQIFIKIRKLERSKQAMTSNFQRCINKLEKQLESRQRKNLNLQNQLKTNILKLDSYVQQLGNQRNSVKKASIQKAENQSTYKPKLSRRIIKRSTSKSNKKKLSEKQ